MSRVPPCFRLSNWRCHGVTHFQERSSIRHRPGSAGGVASWLLAVGASPFPGLPSAAFSTAPPLSSQFPACSVGSVEQSLCEWGIFRCDVLIIISGAKGSDRCPVSLCAAREPSYESPLLSRRWRRLSTPSVQSTACGNASGRFSMCVSLKGRSARACVT